MLFTKKAKKAIGIFALTCFLATPVSYTASMSSAAAAALDNQTQFEQRHNPPGPPRGNNGQGKNNIKRPAAPQRHDNKDKNKPAPSRNDRWNKDKKAPPPPRNDRWNKDRDKKTPPPSPRNDRWNKDRGKNPPPPPPRRHDRDGRWDRDDDKDYDRGDITTAVLVGGVIGAIIAKNT